MSTDYRANGSRQQLSQSIRRNRVASTTEEFITGNFPLSQKEIKQIFEAKCSDVGLKPTPKMYARFNKQIRSKPFNKVFTLESSSLGPQSACVVKNILQSSRRFSILMLSGNNFGNEGAKVIAEAIRTVHSLIHIDLSSNSLQDEGLSEIFNALYDNKNVYSISIGSKTGINHNALGVNAAETLSCVLANNAVLTELDLTMVEITAETIKIIGRGLAENKFLCELNLTSNNIQSKGFISLIPHIIKCNLKVLKLGGNHLQDDCGTVFAQFIKENRTIETIDLSNNNLTSKFINAIKSALSECTTIKSLNLSKNYLMGKGAGYFDEILSSNKTLESLNLQACKVDINGASRIADGLAVNTSLKELVLSNNTLRDEGIVKLATGLESQKGLQRLYLDLTEMSDRGVEVLLGKLTKSQTIEIVSLKNNLIKVGEPIALFAEKNKNIRKLFYEFNDVPLPYCTKINKIMKDNKARRDAEKHSSAGLGAGSIERIEDDLRETREMIKIQRESIIDLKDSLVIAKKESEQSKINMAKAVFVLEIKDRGCNESIKNLRSKGRNLIDELQGKIGIEKQMVENITYTINEEMEKHKNGLSMVASINKDIRKVDENFEKEEEELKDKLSDVKNRYRDAVQTLIEAFRTAKEGPKESEPQKEAEETVQKEEEKEPEKKKPKAKKSKKKKKGKK